jgi:hypothetical protein
MSIFGTSNMNEFPRENPHIDYFPFSKCSKGFVRASAIEPSDPKHYELSIRIDKASVGFLSMLMIET